MVHVVGHCEKRLDPLGYPGAGLQVRRVACRPRALQQQRLQSLRVLRVQFRMAAGDRSGPDGVATVRSHHGFPPPHSAPVRPYHASHFYGRAAILQQRERSLPTMLKLFRTTGTNRLLDRPPLRL